LIRELPDAAATEALARSLALVARPGSAILLSGDVGAGKSTFARAFIHALADDDSFDVPSPTFTLVQAYGNTRIPAAHADLYRIKSADELEELGLEDLAGSHLLLIEWPDRLRRDPAADRLSVELESSGAGRRAILSGAGAWTQALARFAAIEAFLPATPWADARRSFLEGDASSRRYERLAMGAKRAILMDMPARPDGPPVRGGKPYSQIAHLAENISAVIGVNRHLAGQGYSAPEVLAFDAGHGLAVIEDLGDRVYGRMMAAGEDMREPQTEAVRLLADMAARDWPPSARFDGGVHRVPVYDQQALAIETELLTDWFWPFRFDREIPDAARNAFTDVWAELLPLAAPERRVWTLRDYHSPNLIWLPERGGLRRVGLIDTQDCVLGHPAYDLASMLQDARATIPAETERALLAAYCGIRSGFDEAEFRAAYALLGAQRATKILGIFARLSKRDGKHGYLKHMPRVSAYLERNLQHRALAPLKAWYDAHLPAESREAAA
jgi:N-acetylmuramate 1-kinase